LYVGNDNRIQFYSLNNNYHYWIDNNWSDYNSFEEVKSANGCLDVDSNSNIFYIAKDNQIYYYRFNGKTWDLNKIVLSKGEYSAYNDLTIDKIGNLIFKDEIGRIFVIWKTSGYKKITNSYTPTNTNTCSLDGGSIVLTNDLICFKNNDKLSYIDWTNPYFPIDDLVIEHTNLFNYGNSGFVDGRKINGNLHYQKENQRIIYSGYDGRLQAIYNIENNDFSHYWIDNHWLTNDFKMSNVNDSNQCSPSITSSESTKAYYVNHDRTLDNFKWDLCEIQPECSEDSNDLLALRFKKNAEINRLSFKVVPNPVQFDLLKLSFEGEFHPKPSIVKIFNINGQTLKTIELNLQNEIALDISDLKKGTYLVMIINEDKLETKLFVK
jgi:hypothetical protein